ncbi:MAG TPA: DoxX family membrane protein [Candidatus Nanoarchaeia archaeon]|nr:DoxX family membrane protein [Candidatus Nanoarchaeia archaeon]
MLSIFPELFTYSLFAPFILRLVLGAYFMYTGIRHHKEDAALWNTVWNDKKIGSWTVGSILAKVQIAIGVLLILGLWTQIAAILVIVFNKVEWYKRHKFNTEPIAALWPKIFISAIAFSLLFLGAGFLAADLPL